MSGETLLEKNRGFIRVAAILSAAMLACAGPWAQQARAQRQGLGPTKKTDGPPAPLVIVNPLIVGSLKDAEKYLEEGDYKRAFHILDTLITSQGNIFYPLPDGRSYVSIRVKVNDLVGKMKPEGLKLYRTLYNPRAEQLYKQAMESGAKAPVLLQALADDYPHTSWGVKALQTLAAIHMDGGRFIQAAHSWNRALKSISGDSQAPAVPEIYGWNQVLQSMFSDPSEPLVLMKAAVASHLGGNSKGYQDTVEKLKSRYSQAVADLGGKPQRLVEFVEAISSRPPPQSLIRSATGHDWPGIGAVPDGMVLMEECDVVLRPGWRFPEDNPQVPLSQRLCVSMSQARNYNYYNGPQQGNDAKLVGGHVTYKFNDGSGRSQQYAAMPPLIHPIVIDQTVIFRDEKDVIAIDLFTGQQKWKSFKCSLGDSGLIHNYSSYSMNVDLGRMMLTAGQGMVYSLCDFKPRQTTGRNAYGITDPNNGTSCLAALSLSEQGKQKWKIGGGEGDDDLIRNGRFLCAPTYHDGRLYLVSRYMEKFFLLCLRADTGQFIWKTQISMTLPMTGYNPYGMLPDVGTPPAVANGRVIVTTNSGVVASVDAESGQSVWAYQYGTPGSFDPTMGYQPPNPSGRYTASNPIIITKGAVICLPADAKHVVALNFEDGRPFWPAASKIPRGNFTELAAIDSDRFLLSGGNMLSAYNVLDGEQLGYWNAPKGTLQWPVSGRPVVTPESVLVSGEGTVYRMNLRDYSVAAVGTIDPDSLLGNLAVVDGNLIAANPAGVCVYFNYDRARGILTRRFEDVPKDDAKKVFEWLNRRAHLALTNMKYSDALADYRELRRMADKTADAEEKKNQIDLLVPRFYQTYVGLANNADSPAKMLDLFKQAGEYAVTDQDKGHLLLRLARAYERADQFDQAAVCMQKLYEEYPQEDLANVKIGPEAETGSARADMAVRSKGAELARAMLDSLIQNHGQEVYSSMDALARTALDKAKQENNLEAVESVLKRWPFSRHVDEARLVAADTYMKQAVGLDGPPAAHALGNVIRNLWPVASRQGSPQNRQALSALFLLYSRMGQDGAVQAKAIDRSQIPDETGVAFADMKGSLGGILKEIQSGKLKTFSTVLSTCDVRPPLSKIFTLPGKNTFLLRGQDDRPIRLGESVFSIIADQQKECYIVLTDLSADSDQRAERFRGLYNMSDKRNFFSASGSPETKLIGGLSANRDLLTVADRGQIAVYDLGTSKIKWQKSYSQLGIKTFGMMGCGDGSVVIAEQDGKVSCIRSDSDGKIAWSSSVLDRQNVQKIIIWGGMAAVIGKNMKEMGIFDLASGKLMGTFSSRDSIISAAAAGPDKLAAVVDKKLSLFSLEKADGRSKLTNRLVMPLPNYSTTLAGADKDYAVLCATNNTLPLTIVSLAEQSSAEPVKISLPKSKFVVSCALSGDDMYVLAADGVDNQVRQEYIEGRYVQTQVASCNLPTLYKIDPKDGKVAWSVPIGRTKDNSGSQTRFNFSSIVAGASQLSFTGKKFEPSLPGASEVCYIVDTATGKVSQELQEAQEASTDSQPKQTRWNRTMPPAMTNGRLALDRFVGLEVYGGQ
ncbi:MAG: PQQ-binding-like beta-propeller repeat protein [Planctomycetes bacterium]|nr:PQQ-binding-like beta-propeller repeat protein [Planctomycetota bacterium]